jgi:fumarate reductase subunit C
MMSEFFAYGAGPIVAIVLFIVLPAVALYHARTFVKKL